MTTPPTRTWVYTLNNFTEADVDFLKLLVCKAHRCGKEVGAEGTPHLQGALTFERKYRLSALKKLHSRIHWEPAKCADAENYCAKGEVIIDFDHRKQGKRNDLLKAAEIVKAAGPFAVARELPEIYIKFHRGLEKYAYAMDRDPEDRVFYTNTTVVWGKPGTGKSRWCREQAAHEGLRLYNVPEPSGGVLWFDGYDGEEALLFDDFYGWIKRHQLLQLLDIYPLQVQVKGGFVHRKWRRVFITSNRPPGEWYNLVDDGALARRLTEVLPMGPCPPLVPKVEVGNTMLPPPSGLMSYLKEHPEGT